MTSWQVWMGAALVLACAACGAVSPTRSDTVVNARIARTCAPWDGAAFEVAVPMGDGSDPAALPALRVSLWSPAQFDRAQAFTLARDADRTGVAMYVESEDHATPLTGEVRFEPAANDVITGTLRLKADDGRRFERRFRGRLDPRVAMCG